MENREKLETPYVVSYHIVMVGDEVTSLQLMFAGVFGSFVQSEPPHVVSYHINGVAGV